jgi:hypothetical protein
MLFMDVFKIPKEGSHISLVKLVERLRLVASGERMDNEGFRFMKPYSHSTQMGTSFHLPLHIRMPEPASPSMLIHGDALTHEVDIQISYVPLHERKLCSQNSSA